MGRFSGWTMADVAKLGITRAELQKEPAGESQIPTSQAKYTRDYAGEIQGALGLLGIESVREYRFHPSRKFRFDLAIPDLKIAIEFEGLVFGKGEKSRHTQSAGYAKDCKKYNLAVLCGWRVLRYTTVDTKMANWEFAIADEVKQLIVIITAGKGQN